MTENDETTHLAAQERSQTEPEQVMQDGNNNAEPKLSPVQIQQEYFENLPEYDWVKWVNDDLFVVSNR